jgi:hypothetical protein
MPVGRHVPLWYKQKGLDIMSDTPAPRKVSPETPFEIRDMRDSPFFWIDNRLYDDYAAAIGLEGLGLYAALARYANNKTGQCWPSFATLATAFGCTPKTIASHLHRLEEFQLVRIAMRPGQSPLISLLKVPPRHPRKNDGGSHTPEEPPPPDVKNTPPAPVKRAREQSEENKTQEQNPIFSSSFSTKKKEEEKALSPYELPPASREAQCQSNHEGIGSLLATLWPEERGSRQAGAVSAAGCLHEHLNDLGACNDCGEILVSAAAD